MIPTLIVLNAGSSSLKFQVFEMMDGAEPHLVWKGLYEGLGGAARFVVRHASGTDLDRMSWSSGDQFGHEEALMHLVSWLREHQGMRKLVALDRKSTRLNSSHANIS